MIPAQVESNRYHTVQGYITLDAKPYINGDPHLMHLSIAGTSAYPSALTCGVIIVDASTFTRNLTCGPSPSLWALADRNIAA